MGGAGAGPPGDEGAADGPQRADSAAAATPPTVGSRRRALATVFGVVFVVLVGFGICSGIDFVFLARRVLLFPVQ